MAKVIPRIALNFQKWKLQQKMMKEIGEMNADPDQSPLIIADRVQKYTKAFDLLDSLGADNCIDPEDFDQEDLEDEMFANLKIKEIEDLFAQAPSKLERPEEETPLLAEGSESAAEDSDLLDDSMDNLQF